MIIEPGSLKPGKRYFLMASCIIPRPIAWVATLNEDLTNNLAPISFFNGASSTPPLLLLGFGPPPGETGKLEKDTLRNLRRTGELTVSIPGFELVNQVEATGTDLPYGEDEFSHAGLKTAASSLVGPPRVAEAGIAFECKVDQIIPLGKGDSILVLAEVKLIHLKDEFLDERGCVDPRRFQALARMGGGRYAGVGQVFKTGEKDIR